MHDDACFSVRTLDEPDAAAFQAIRLEALRREGENFGPTYEHERTFDFTEWRRHVTPTADTRIFGLFDGAELIGIMRVTAWDADPNGKTALWGQAYVKPKYRNKRGRDQKKISAPLYEARAEWTWTRYTSAVVFIRGENAISQNIHLKHGANFMFERILSWPDRSPSLWKFYRITPENTASAQHSAIRHLDEILTFLKEPEEPRAGSLKTLDL